jgi:hypothetical protein
MKYGGSQADIRDTLELSDGNQQAIEVGFAGIGFEVAKGDDCRFLVGRFFAVGFLAG